MNVRLLSLVCLVALFGQYSGSKLDARSKVCREYGLSSEHCAHLGTKAFEEEIVAFMHTFIENGAPAYGVPPLDPLNYEGNVHIENFNFNDLLDLEYANLDNIHSTKLDQFIANHVNLNILQLTLDFNFTFPEINLDLDHYNLSAALLNVIPATGDGEFDIKITDLTVAGQIKPGTRPEGWLYIQDLSLDLQLGGTNLLVTGLMGGSRVTYMASEIVSEAAPQVVGQLGPMLGPQVLTIVNTVMDNIQLTLSDILNCLNGGDCLGQGKYSQS